VAAAARAEPAQVTILVLKEHGMGSPTLAQPYVDRFVARAAEQNGWNGARGRYLTNRSAAESAIRADAPQFGMFSLAAFLALRETHRLEVIGRVASSLAGGEQYFVVSKTARDLAGCRGRTLASDHTDDARFVERVVARGQFALADFQLMQNLRPLQSLRQVLLGEADCALVDDAQLAELAKLPGGAEARVVWTSQKLPSMAVVAFPGAPASLKKGFQANLSRLCAENGRTACAEVGIHALEGADAGDYADVVSAYGP
jgi:hypothetical protein